MTSSELALELVKASIAANPQLAVPTSFAKDKYDSKDLDEAAIKNAKRLAAFYAEVLEGICNPKK